MAENRPDIPEPIKREVRRRCGFCCVICGIPLYHYEHMIEWSQVKRHDAENITLLCPHHHDQKTRNHALPLEKIIEANQNPYGRSNAYTKHDELHFGGKSLFVDIATNTFSIDIPEEDNDLHHFYPLIIDGQPIIQFSAENNRMLLNLNLYDAQNKPAVIIVDNEITLSTENWDIEYKAFNLVVRNKPRDIFVDLTFKAPGIVMLNRACVCFNNIYLLIDKHGLSCLNDLGTIRGNEITNSQYGYSYEKNNSISILGGVKIIVPPTAISTEKFDLRSRKKERNCCLKRFS